MPVIAEVVIPLVFGALVIFGPWLLLIVACTEWLLLGWRGGREQPALLAIVVLNLVSSLALLATDLLLTIGGRHFVPGSAALIGKFAQVLGVSNVIGFLIVSFVFSVVIEALILRALRWPDVWRTSLLLNGASFACLLVGVLGWETIF